MKKNKVLPLIVITGPTASGKSSLAIKIASQVGGEIISADSRAIYIGADIGTAKPTKNEQKMVPHWGIDLVKPGDYFSVSDYKNYTDKKINEIKLRGHIPILVGGTGLYIDSVIFDYKFGKIADNLLRSKLQHKSIDYLQEYCINNSINLPENSKNKRYLIRAIENNGSICTKNESPPDNCIVVGITTEKEELLSRINNRIDVLISDGVINEAKKLGNTYGWDSEAMKSNIYRLINLYLNNEISFDDIKRKCIVLDWRLAKRQMTWMRRNKFIHWFSLNDAEKYIIDQLAIIEQL